ncbi:MAG: C-GCAxxG-C-C family protein [Candidatus Symbiothrix sp.]|jgi:hypothetical protein|nr:C-GCAxxG-C-C family protein [Candidatus Symbiothrix sp.]
MPRTKSERFFHAKPENLNCAQAILNVFSEELNIPQQRIDEFQSFGGGHAPNGLCGALFAAETLLAEHGKPSVKEKFRTLAGGITCHEIKEIAKTPCLQCLRFAEKLLEENLAEFHR